MGLNTELVGSPRKGLIPHRESPFLLVSFYPYFSLISDIAFLARERDGCAESAGKKRKKSLSCFEARLCICMPLFLLTTLSSGLFPQKMGGVPPDPPIFKGKSPRDEVVLPKHLPHIDSTLH